MKFVLSTAAALAMLLPAAALAQTAPTTPDAAGAPASAPTPGAATIATAPAAKFNLDTPIETLVADPKAKAVLDADFGADITTNPQYDGFKAMSLNQVKPYAPDKLPDELLKKIETDLAAIQ